MKQSIRDSLKSFFRRFPYILLLVLLISVPVNVIQTCFVDVRFQSIDVAQLEEDPGGVLSKVLIYYFLLFLLSIVLNMLFIGVMLLRRQDYDGTPVRFREIFEESLVLLPKVWLTQLLSGIIVAIGFTFFMLPGIILYYIFYMVPYAVTYRKEWGRRGLYVASRYPKKHGRTVVGVILFDLVYRIVITAGISALVYFVPLSGNTYTIFSVGVYCLRDLLFCIPFSIIGGIALSLPIEVQNPDGTVSHYGNTDDSQE